MKTIKELKNTILEVVSESYKKAKSKDFSELNFVFIDNKSPLKHLKGKIEIFKNLDEYSQTFLSIHTRAKLALREFQSNEFSGSYLELLRLILTLPEVLNSDKLKSVNVNNIDNSEIISSKEILVSVKPENIKLKSGTKIIKEKITGKKIVKQKQKDIQESEELQSLEFEEDFDEESEALEFENEEFIDDNIEDLEL